MSASSFDPYSIYNPITAGTGISVTSGTTSITLSGVTAGTYGSSTNIPQITVDALGRISTVNSIAISALPTFTVSAAAPSGGANGDVWYQV